MILLQRCSPLLPQIFFSRNAALGHMLHLLEKSKPNPVYIVILGTGGIGKIALSVVFLHHPSTIMHFRDFQWFISCEGVFNADSRRSALAKAFKLDEKTDPFSPPTRIIQQVRVFAYPRQYRDTLGA